VGAALAGLSARTVHNADYATGRTGSLRAGLAALPAADATVVIALADQPLLEADDVARLLEAFARRGAARVVAPRVAGQRGHPLVVEGGVCRAIMTDAADVGIRQWMDAHPSQVAWLDCDNDRYCVDVDEPQDLERISRRYGCELRWP
jgi:CTP:molybdopterin cytidylyltransferase MocA